MKLRFLGVGSAFTMDGYQTNMVLEDENFRLLIDCGTDIRHSAANSGLTFKDFNAVYISHLHADHIGGLEWLAFMTYFNPDCPRPRLFISEVLVEPLWNNCLVGGLGSIQGRIMHLEDYFEVIAVPLNGTFQMDCAVGGVYSKSPEFRLVQTVHVMNGFSIVPSFGLLFDVPAKGYEDNSTKVFITCDTQFCPHQIMDFYCKADYIVQDCETSPFKSGVHAHLSDLLTLPQGIQQKMLLCHYQTDPYPFGTEDGSFRGMAKVGVEYSLNVRRDWSTH